uniref:Uncharacterized protein n=1 Tax=Arundo donax TaxID=35708 RepID=A0A0A8YAU2_ARUDO
MVSSFRSSVSVTIVIFSESGCSWTCHC